MTSAATSSSTVAVIGPNPAEDRILEVRGFSPDGVFRARRSLHGAGGKPLNVARVMSRLGITPLLVVPLGPNVPVGNSVQTACRDLAIDLRAIPISGDTRTCTVIVDPESGRTAVINELGPELTELEAATYEEAAVNAVTSHSLAIASGSLPRGLGPEFYGHLAAAACRVGTGFILDSSAAALARALNSRPWAIKVNADEIREVSARSGLIASAEWVRECGVDHVVVTNGSAGAIYLGSEGAFHVSSPVVQRVNTVGAGDAFSAGLLYGLATRGSWLAALPIAAATSGLWISRFEPDIGLEPDLETLASEIELEPLEHP